MKISSLSVLLSEEFEVDKKFYLIGGNEVTLMYKIKSKIIEKYRLKSDVQIINIETIDDYTDEAVLFENKKLFIVSGLRGVNEKNLNNLRESNNDFIFVQENSQKTKRLKSVFNSDRNSYLIDCYELDKDSKIRILNEFLRLNNLKIPKEVYWLLADKLDGKYFFFENTLEKISKLDKKDITYINVKKILTIDDSGKERIFFNLLKKNKEIIALYRDKIITDKDVNDLFYYSRSMCQLIIDCKDEDEYNKKIPIYLFKEKKYLIEIYKKYNSKKKKLLLNLLTSTEKILRKESKLSYILGLRFLLNIKKITIS